MDLSLDFGRRPIAGAGVPARAALGRIPLAYIMAATHSGSTMLAMQLARQPGVCTVGELSGTHFRAEPGYRCSCGAELVRCGFWAEVSAAMAKRGFSFDATTAETDIRNAPDRYARRLLRPMHRGRALELLRDAALALSPSARRYLRRHEALKAALAESVLECAGDALLVDSSKLGVQLKYLLRSPRFDVKVIWLVRDGRAVSASLMRNEPLPMRAAAYEWRRFYEEAHAIVRRLERARWMQVRYEELCAEPERILGELWRFLGVSAEMPLCDAREQHVLGHTSRLNGVGKVTVNEKWRRELGAADLRAFDAVAGRANRALGYA